MVKVIMKNTDIKNLVSQIKRYAGTTGDAPPGSGGTPAAPAPGGGWSPPTAQPGGSGNRPSYTPGIPEVRSMQEAMIDLAKTVMADASTMIHQVKEAPIAGGAKQVDKKGPVAKSRKGFADFVAEQYVGSLDDRYKGEEYSKDEKKTSYTDKNKVKSDIYELDVVMNTIQRIGGGNAEFKADGFWGFRTDNALRNLLGFAYAMMQLENDFGVQTNIYHNGNWTKFALYLQGYTVNPNNKEDITLPMANRVARAKDIVNHLKAIKKLYLQVKSQILAKPQYVDYIDGEHSFDTLPKDSGVTITQEHIDNATKNTKSTVTLNLPTFDEKGVKQEPREVQMPVRALMNETFFKGFLRSWLKCPEKDLQTNVFPIYKEIQKQLFRLTDEGVKSEPIAQENTAPTEAAPAAPTETSTKI
jgi:hypothetical protein